MATHLFFDFFGTLVDYSPSRTEQGYERSFALLREAGARLDYGEFLSLWSEVAEGFEAEAERTRREFSMVELGRAFLARVPGAPPVEGAEELVRVYVEEWNQGVTYLDGVVPLLERLSRRFPLAVITNTHDHHLVPAHLERMGAARFFERVITSVELGTRKPAVEIFAHAVRAGGAAAADCVHVGDSYHADYRGALAAGLRPLLIDPQRRAPVPDGHRIASVLEVESRL